MSFDFKERFKELQKFKKKFFYEELRDLLLPCILNEGQIEEVILKNTRTINERINKGNINFFRKIYPGYEGNLKEDKNNVGSYTIKYFVSKF